MSKTNNEKETASTKEGRETSTREHTLSTIALCLCTLTFSYLLISVFPYSGYLVIELIPSANEENAGSYAGLIASAFMIGRATTSYAWGKAADIYGRTTVMYASLCLSCIFTFLFGLSRSFPLALLWRFMLGLGNGMMGTAKTAVSELAGGDSKLETRAMGMVMGMWGWGFLISPVISGALSEPIKQYPNAEWLQHGALDAILNDFPFLLPNLVGSLLCVISIVFVRLFVTETLPEHQLRDAAHIPGDAAKSVRKIYERLLSSINEDEETRPLNVATPTTYTDTLAEDDSEDLEIPSVVLAFIEDDVADAMRESEMLDTEQVTLLATGNPRASLVSAVTKRTSVVSEERRMSRMSIAQKDEKEATIASLLSEKNVRNHLVVYWVASFVMVAVDEGFPLFCISKNSGLGLSENSIGRILSASGVIFAFSQYFVYSKLVDWIGLYGSIRFGSLSMGPLVATIPISLYLNRGMADDEMTSGTFAFLAIIMAAYRVFGLVFFSSLIVATNRTVLPTHRGTMNGLSALGGSIAKGAGPTFAGLLVSFSFSSGLFAPHVGAVFMWLVIGLMGGLCSWATFALLSENDDGEREKGIATA